MTNTDAPSIMMDREEFSIRFPNNYSIVTNADLRPSLSAEQRSTARTGVADFPEPILRKPDEIYIKGNPEGMHIRDEQRGMSMWQSSDDERMLLGIHQEEIGIFSFSESGNKVADWIGGVSRWYDDADGEVGVTIASGQFNISKGDIVMSQHSSLIKLGLSNEGLGLGGPHGLQFFDDDPTYAGMALLYRSGSDTLRVENISTGLNLFSFGRDGEFFVGTGNGFVNTPYPGATMYRHTTAQGIGAGTTARVLFNGTARAHNNFVADETSTSSIQVPWTGVYRIYGTIRQENLTSGGSLVISARRNASTAAEQRLFHFRGTGTSQQHSFCVDLGATAGDFISLWGEASHAVTLGVSADYMRWGIEWVGR